ncbi:MAG: hypothetical protein PHE15_05020 [Dehalococcoidales bacterium]|nr:hypothetical protein [Dehalococcoidales bacterium]
MVDEEQNKIENLRLEYQLTQDMAIHYDTMNWTIGTILIAGVFGTIGLIGEKLSVYPTIAVLSFLILIIWRFYYKRHKDIQHIKFTRLHEIEKELNLQQHLRIKTADDKSIDKKMKKEKIFGLKGDYRATLLTFGVPAVILIIYLLKTK